MNIINSHERERKTLLAPGTPSAGTTYKQIFDTSDSLREKCCDTLSESTSRDIIVIFSPASFTFVVDHQPYRIGADRTDAKHMSFLPEANPY